MSEVGVENRRFPDRESKPSTQHPHRTHDTTDQWRETLWWLGRSWDFGLLAGSRGVGCRQHMAMFFEAIMIDFVTIRLRLQKGYRFQCSSHAIKIRVLWKSPSSHLQKCNTSNRILTICYYCYAILGWSHWFIKRVIFQDMDRTWIRYVSFLHTYNELLTIPCSRHVFNAKP